MTSSDEKTSPRWNNTTKIVVGLTLSAILVLLVIRFQYIIAPMLFAFILSYLLHPLANFFHEKLKIPWRLITTLIYVLLFLIIIGLLTWGGISIFDQVQNLIKFIQGLLTDLPGFFANLSSKPLEVGPFSFDLSHLDFTNLWTQLQGIVQPILTNLGSLIGSLASGIGSTLTWTLLILLISYFILAESMGVRKNLIRVQIPNYQEDITRLGGQLSHIWNAFLRGQLLIFVITVGYYSILLSILGVRYFFLLAILAGLARFVPYIGPFVAWTTYGLVALFQVNHFGMQPFPFALLVVGCSWLSDVILDNFMVPRVMSDALEIHPAAVLVMVIISASLFGLLGVLLAAPVLASLKLIMTYIFRKMTDRDPWEGLKVISPAPPLAVIWSRFASGLVQNWSKFLAFWLRIWTFVKTFIIKVFRLIKPNSGN